MGTTKAALLAAFARNVTGFRRHHRLSQDQLAGACGLARATIVAIERGQHLPRVETLLALANALETTPARLLDDASAHTTITQILARLRAVLAGAAARDRRVLVRMLHALADLAVRT